MDNMMMHHYKDLSHSHHTKYGGRYLVENGVPAQADILDQSLFEPKCVSVIEYISF